MNSSKLALQQQYPARAQAPIGVFDSGIGGLSVLRALHAELPLEQFCYVADSGHAPYGEREEQHIVARSYAITRHLVEQHQIKALVVACNTATAAAIATLRHDFANLPIVGIEPALKPAATLSQTHCIGVMATRRTLDSQKFQALWSTLQGQAHFVLQACDGLAAAIEAFDTPKIIAACAEYTRAMGRFGTQEGAMDTLVLGCTHYPFAADVLHQLLGEQVQLVEAGPPVARHTRRLLAQHGWLRPAAAPATAPPPTQFATTGRPEVLHAALQRWLGLVVSPQVLCRVEV